MKDQLQTIRAALTKRGWATEKEAAEALTALAQLEAMVGEQEPVAWQHKVHEGGKWLTTDLDPDAAAEWNFLHESRPLYAAPVAQQPQAEPDWINGVPHWSPALIAKVKQMPAELDEPEQPQAEAVPSDVVLDAERWKAVQGFEGVYEVSSIGRVRSLDRVDSDGNKRVGRFMTPTAIRKGYLKVSLNQANVRREIYVHRMVAAAFLDNPMNLPQVNHKDGDPANNEVSNLEWVTNQQNAIHAKRVLARGVRAVYGLSKTDGSRVDFPSLQHAVEAGFVRANIQKCIAGIREHHRGYQWFDAAIDAAMAQGEKP